LGRWECDGWDGLQARSRGTNWRHCGQGRRCVPGIDEEEEIKVEPAEPTTWKLLTRYMDNFKPNTNAMFKRFTDDVWHLRSGIKYLEKGKHYDMVTLFSKGDYDFMMRGGPWILNQNALIVKDLDKAAQPSETILNSVPVWAHIYDVPWG
jgi:hypothetical protein